MCTCTRMHPHVQAYISRKRNQKVLVSGLLGLGSHMEMESNQTRTSKEGWPSGHSNPIPSHWSAIACGRVENPNSSQEHSSRKERQTHDKVPKQTTLSVKVWTYTRMRGGELMARSVNQICFPRYRCTRWKVFYKQCVLGTVQGQHSVEHKEFTKTLTHTATHRYTCT